ncbi:MAG: DUF1697 domain-containing protein [Pyrinomonadaceae bacterium]
MRYVALLRGINVGGNTMVRMEELRRTFEALGFKNVTSYINSGNLAFDARKTSETTLVKKIEDAVERLIDKRVQVMVREQQDIDRVIANNPFDGEYQNHKEMHVLFLRSGLSEDQVASLTDATRTGEHFQVSGREIYCHLPMGVADSNLGRGQFEKKLKAAVTARNWRTVQKLADL